MKSNKLIGGLASILLLASSPQMDSNLSKMNYYLTKPVYAQEKIVKKNKLDIEKGVIYHTVKKGETIKSIAKEYWGSRKDSRRIKKLNPEYSSFKFDEIGMFVMDDGDYVLRKGARIRVMILQTPGEIERKEKREIVIYHKVKKGDYFRSIGEQYWNNEACHETLKELNPGIDIFNLKAGQKLKIKITDLLPEEIWWEVRDKNCI